MIVYIHPAVFRDQRHVDALVQRTGQRIDTDRHGRSLLAEPGLEDTVRLTLDNLEHYAGGGRGQPRTR